MSIGYYSGMAQRKHETTLETFARRLSELREAKGITRYRLAILAGVDSAYLGHLEGGRKNPSWEVVCKLADALGVTVADFRPAK